MTPVRWDPFREMEQLLQRYAHAPGRGGPQREAAHEQMTRADWVPVVDISETGEEYLIKVELPEVDKDAIKVSGHGGVLLIEGERRFPEEEGRKYHRVERNYGTFARSFTLPENVEQDQIAAEHRDGVLYLHLPKQQEPQPKSVEIKVK